MGIGITYAFKDLVGVLNNAIAGVSLPLTGGNIGNGSITITMATERTAHDLAADGTIMPSYISGRNGNVAIEVQQTSILHKQLLSLYNILESAAENDDVSGWAATGISFRTVAEGSQHILQGVSFSKIPDKPYQQQGQKITWNMMAADIQNS